MFRALRLRRAHKRFLESCRSLREGKAYWSRDSGLARRILDWVCPVPTLALHEGGAGLMDALEWLEAHCRTCPLSEDVLRQYHRMTCPFLGTKVGAYRRDLMRVEGNALPCAAPDRIPALMRRFGLRLGQVQGDWDRQGPPGREAILAEAIEIHQRIGLIHPFSDGNGRVSRLAMNHFLRRYGLGYVIFPPLSEESPLWEALKKADLKDPGPLARFASKCHYPV